MNISAQKAKNQRDATAARKKQLLWEAEQKRKAAEKRRKVAKKADAKRRKAEATARKKR